MGKRVRVIAVASLAVAAGFMQLAAGEAARAASPEVQALQRQIETLQSEMQAKIAALQSQIDEMQRKENVRPEPPPPKPATVVPTPKSSYFDSNYPLRLYGKIKIDAIYDSIDFGADEYIKYIAKNAADDGQVSFTAREARLGIAFGGPTFFDGWNASGRLETDFYGSGDNLRLRLGYVDLQKGATKLRIGQDWLPLASLNPATLNFTIMGYHGNLWGRVPQVTATRQLGEQFAATVTAFRDRDALDSEHGLHTDMEVPWIGAKINYRGPLALEDDPIQLGFSVAARRGKVDSQSVTPYLLAWEFKTPLGPFEWQGEAFYGRGLGGEFLRKGLAYNLHCEAMEALGGWTQLGAQLGERTRLHIGFGLDHPQGEIVAGEAFRSSRYLFGNLYYDFTDDLSVAIEATGIRTEWSDRSREGLRLQHSWIYLW